MLLRFLTAAICLINFAWGSSFEPPVFGCNYFPPLKIDNSDRPGIDVEILREIFPNGGAQTVFMPWKRAYDKALKGELDGLCSCSHSPEREKSFLFSRKIDDVEVGFFTLDGQALNIGALKGKTIGVARGYNLHKELEGAGAKLQLSNLELPLIKMLLSGRIDAIYTFRLPVEHEIAKNGASIPNLKFERSRTAPYFYCVSKNAPQSAALIDRINNELERLQKAGFIEKVKAKYLTPKHP